jgi:hypothetical protein
MQCGAGSLQPQAYSDTKLEIFSGVIIPEYAFFPPLPLNQ